jgi:YgiT-type zinc finger domain-containing protein
MHCLLCKGNCEEKLTTFMVDIDSCIVIVKNVPAKVCCQCEEPFFSDEVLTQLEEIVNSFRRSLTEIAIVNFQECVA